jgi:8-oxo-dGTP pyrophosphatase MutT (NUDIX family)
MTRHSLIKTIKSYSSPFVEEENHKIKFLQLLDHPRSFYRDHIPGHITGSAWIVNDDFSKTLLVLHAKLGRWLQPGGHADGNENVLEVALREAEEETGLHTFNILKPSFFDLDIHPIPQRGDFPSHLHFDVRFLVQACEQDSLKISEESIDLKWFEMDEIGDITGHNLSILRMIQKTLHMQTGGRG